MKTEYCTCGHTWMWHMIYDDESDSYLSLNNCEHYDNCKCTKFEPKKEGELNDSSRAHKYSNQT